MRSKKVLLSLVAVVFISFLINCGGSGTASNQPIVDDSQNSTTEKRSLTKYASCDDLLVDLKTSLQADLKESFKPEYYVECSMVNSPVEDDSTEGTLNTPKDIQDTGFTSTNLQESNVDESDEVKTDGNNIYVATLHGVDIFNAWPLNAVHRIGRINLDPEEALVDPKPLGSMPVWNNANSPELFLQSDQLILVRQVYAQDSYTTQVKIFIYNVKEPSKPELLKTRVLDGSLLGARIVNSNLHVLLSHSINFKGSLNYPEIDNATWDDLCSSNQSKKAAAKKKVGELVQEALDQNLKLVANSKLEDWNLPRTGDGVSQHAVSCDQIASDGVSVGTSLIGQYSLRLVDSDPREQTTFVKGNAYLVYASLHSIYLAYSDYADFAYPGMFPHSKQSEQTFIHRFSLDSTANLHEYAGSGSVPGHVLNQFSMGEDQGVFRIATTIGNVWSNSGKMFNSVYLLDTQKSDLPLLGKLENIAPGETLQSARFFGKKGYLVTFRQIDPLFVLDLTDPKTPKVEGELKMPGYSTYLQALDNTHLMGLGYNVLEDGRTFDGIKLSLFDLSQVGQPRIADEESIGSNITSSEALYDHHAFTFDSNTQTLALPVYFSGRGDPNVSDVLQYSGVHLYTITPDQGIKEKAVVTLPKQSTPGRLEIWSGYSSPKRTILMQNTSTQALFVIDQSKLYAVDLTNPAAMASSVELTDKEDWLYYDLMAGPQVK